MRRYTSDSSGMYDDAFAAQLYLVMQEASDLPGSKTDISIWRTTARSLISFVAMTVGSGSCSQRRHAGASQHAHPEATITGSRHRSIGSGPWPEWPVAASA